MFLLDDILLAPIKGLAAVCQKVHDAAQEDLADQEKAVLATLAELHQQLDAGFIADADFNARECELLDRLEVCQQARNPDRRGGAGEEALETATGSEPRDE
jgi:hypothetical protein